MTAELEDAVASVAPSVVGWRRQFHQHPELAYQERATSQVVEHELRKLDLDVMRPGLGSTGVAALLKGTGPAPRGDSALLLRADMDALPINEETGLSFASATQGVMHACGHDAHTAILLGVAKVLSGLRGRLATDVLFMFQPAEEIGSGARRMLDDGLFDIARPDAAYMLHVWHDLDAGTVAIPTGPVMAGALTFKIEVNGRGGHAARPHLALDPVVASAEIVTTLQLLVSREVDPAQPTVVTIGSVRAGDAANVIPMSATLLGTARSYDLGVLSFLERRITEIASQIARALRLSAEVRFDTVVPPVVNDITSARLATQAITAELGPTAVGIVGPSMGSEDFANVLQQVPGAMIRLGVRSPATSAAAPIHTSMFNLDESALRVGVTALCAIALHRNQAAESIEKA